MLPLEQLRNTLKRSYTRSILWVEGERETFAAPIHEVLQRFEAPQDAVLLLSDRSVAGLQPVPRGEFVRHLGSRYQLIFMDAYAGLNPATIAQALGTIEGGGLLILMTPPAADWPGYFDSEYLHLGIEAGAQAPGHFIRWLLNGLTQSDAVVRYGSSCHTAQRLEHQRPSQFGQCLGADQMRVVEQLLESWQKPRSCVVLDADRGRGKSSALGLALGQQTGFSAHQIALCAPDRRAVGTLMQRFAELQPDAIPPRCYTPAELVTRLASADTGIECVLVDEAAGVPVSVLQALAQRVPHLVLSSTLHGYEGLAQGYGLRFLKQLAAERPECNRLELNLPLRWAPNDPVEAWTDRFLLLRDAVSISDFPEGLHELGREELCADPARLSAIYQLLAQAHYRTSPADLRLLLDGPGQRLFTAVHQGELVGVVWIAQEGPISPSLAIEIMQGRRRPKGDLLPQSILHYLGWREAGNLCFWRVVRIAIAEPYRRQGHARTLLAQLETEAKTAGIDFVGASFAGHADLRAFWLHCGYQLVRQGESVDPVAAEPALLVLKATSVCATEQLALYSNAPTAAGDVRREARDRSALYNVAYHFAPLSLVRDQLGRFAPTSEVQAVLEQLDPSPAQQRIVRSWLQAYVDA